MKIERNLSCVLSILILITSFMPSYASAYAETVVSTEASSSASSGGGSSGGVSVGGGSSVSVSTEIAYTEYTATGTIYLPNGITAPKGGVDVYCAFGGVSFETPTTLSLMSPATTSTISEVSEDESESVSGGSSGSSGGGGSSTIITVPSQTINNSIKYEKFGVVATIPYGSNSVTYRYTFKLPSSYKAFYGKFWTLNSNYSNQTVLSNIALVSSGKTEYSNINATLYESESLLTGTVSLPDNTILSSDIDIYIIASNDYDEFITKSTVKAGNSSCDYIINGLTNSDYKLTYYIPSYNDMDKQAIKQSTITCNENISINGNTDFDFSLEKGILISGTISIAENRIPQNEPINIEVSVQNQYSGDERQVICQIPIGASSAYYQIGVSENDRVEIIYTVLNRNDIAEEYNSVYTDIDNISDFNMMLESVYPVQGTVKAPTDLKINEDTYFFVNVVVYGITNDCMFGKRIQLNDDKLQEDFLIQIPEDFATGEYEIYYDFLDSTEAPSTPYNPIPYYKGTSSGGSGGGGSSSGESAVSDAKSFEIPPDLLQKRKFYITVNGISASDKQAEKYQYNSTYDSKVITLAKIGDFEILNRVGGYFTSALSVDNEFPLKISLINTGTDETKTLDFNFNGSKELYIFDTQDGKYILKYNIGDEIFYYNNNRLVTDKNSAEIISLAGNEEVYKKDVYYKNTFPVNAKAYCTNSENAEILKIYDITGKLISEHNACNTLNISISKFILGIGDLYFSEFDGYTFSGLTKNIDEALEINTQYRDIFAAKIYGEFEIDTTYTDEAENPIVGGNWIDDGNYTEPVLNGSTFEITTSQELAWVSYKVMTGSTFINKTVKLMNDIDISAHQWTPIGGIDENKDTSTSNVFKGIFDGSGYCINGLNIGNASEYASYEYCGLFGYASATSFKKISMKSIKIYNYGNYSGGVVGYSEYSNYNNLKTYGSIIGTGIIGGIVGETHGNILNCLSDMIICSTDNIYSGGIVGKSYYSGTIENCVTFGENTSSRCGGGLAGYANAIFKNCYSDTQITSSYGSVFAYYFNNMYSNCWYNSDNGIGTYNANSNSTTKLIPKITNEIKSNDFLETLNNNSNTDWMDWVMSDDGYPVVTDTQNRFWQPCSYDLEETENTYTVTSAEELAWIAECVNNGNSFSGKTIVLASDIDLSNKFWIPIGNENYSFQGMFDGQNNTVTGLKFNSDNNNVGLFGYVENAIIKDIKLLNIDIKAYNNVGALCAKASIVSIENCFAQGKINGNENIGGIVGYIDWGPKSVISKSSVDINITGKYNVGGIVGFADYFVSISETNFDGNISCDDNAGGIIGNTNYGDIKNCYTSADITGKNNIGGLLGWGYTSISNCYSNSSLYGGICVGGIVGYHSEDNNITSTYWNIDKAQQEDGFTLTNSSKKGIGSGTDTTSKLSAEQFANQINFINWDFDTVWCINDGFPTFKRLVKQYDYSISDISIVGNYVVTNITKNVDILGSDKIYFATYIDGKLTDMICDNLEIEKGTKMITSSKALNISNESNTVVKVFIWNNSLMPLSLSKEITYINQI